MRIVRWAGSLRRCETCSQSRAGDSLSRTFDSAIRAGMKYGVMGKVQCVVAGLGLTAAMAIGCAEHHAACAPGEIAACSCSDGRAGAMRCGSASMFAPCVCSSGSCVAGTEAACTCADGTSGLQWCGPGGVPGACACASGGCVPGRSVACACASGASGAQLCNTDGRFGMCACDSAFDAARVDAGSVTLLDTGSVTLLDTGSATPVDTGPRPDTAADAPPFDAGSGAGLCRSVWRPRCPRCRDLPRDGVLHRARVGSSVRLSASTGSSWSP